jgi:hypothetical protein
METKLVATINVAKELAALQKMTGGQLRTKYAEVFGEESRSGHKEWLVKRIAWRIQANIEGDLSERARRRGLELANEADLRLKAPTTLKLGIEPKHAPRTVQTNAAKSPDDRLPPVGTVITRDYRGQKLSVTVRSNGLEYAGELYRSLSAVAKAITGTHINGYLFFALGKYAGGAK